MKPKNTLVWLVVAVALFAFIFVYNRFLRPTLTPLPPILTGLQPSSVTSVQVIPGGALEIEADYTNGAWLLTKPVAYPAQPAAVETLLRTLQKLTPAIRISGGELREQHNAEMEYGFDPPRSSIVIEQADGHQWQLQVGNKTAPGDQVFLRLVGTDGVFVSDSDWLKYIPRSADDWRGTALVDFGDNVPDWIVITNGTKVIELRQDPGNHLWQMTRPLLARADGERIVEALQALQTARVSQFVADNSPDLSRFGLQPANMDLWFGEGTNCVAALHVGNSATNDGSMVYVERQGWNTVMTTARNPLSPWFGPVNSFRDPYLFDLSAPVAEIEVRGGTNFGGFTLEQQGTNGWRVLGQNFPVDTGSVQQFIQMLASLRVSEFVKDVATTPDLTNYGLASPVRQITLLSAAGDTNAVIAQLLFGNTQTNEIFVRRADEDSIYAVPLESFANLCDAGWQLRERQIWNFSEADVARIIVRQNGKSREMVHNGPNQWSLAPGSEGIIVPAAIEETAHQFGQMSAVAWLARNPTDTAAFGFKPGNLSITLDLKNGTERTVDFGKSGTETAVAAVTLDGERWAFVLQPVLYQLISSYLTIPANGS